MAKFPILNLILHNRSTSQCGRRPGHLSCFHEAMLKLSESGRALSGRVCLLRARDNDEGESGGSKSNA